MYPRNTDRQGWKGPQSFHVLALPFEDGNVKHRSASVSKKYLLFIIYLFIEYPAHTQNGNVAKWLRGQTLAFINACSTRPSLCYKPCKLTLSILSIKWGEQTIMGHSTVGIHLEKCIIMQSHHCVHITECSYTNEDDSCVTRQRILIRSHPGEIHH